MPLATSVPDRSRLRHSRIALAHSLSPTAWRESLEFRSADATRAPALRVGAAVLVVLVAGGLLDLPHPAGFAALGALASAFGRHEPYSQQAGKIAVVGLGVVGYAALGAAVGTTGAAMWTQIAVLSVAAAIAFWILGAFRLSGPGPVILIFAAAGAAGFARTAVDVRDVVVATALGALVGWAVAMLPALHHPHGPARLAVARALAAVAAIERDGERAVPGARAAIARAHEVLALGFSRTDRHTHELLALLDAAETVVDGAASGVAADRVAEFALFEAELRKVRRDIAIPRVDAAGAPVLARPAGFAREGFARLRDRALLVGAGRVLLAALIAGWFAEAAGLQHPLWATMGAMAALQGANYRNTVQRAIQRLLGNVAGAVLAAALLALSLDYWPYALAIVVLQTVAELYVMKNYAATSVAVTAMALLLTGLGASVGPEIALSRIADTLVGVVVGVLVAAATIDRSDRHHLTAAPAR
ncbi:FUSC family protein [Rhodococcus aetherivorans]|uniref:FUSC family protein n=1 Tax=Rhodococcus aetherivorans TaxID=191292 RepID=UPI00241F9F28|nr:FUSC family protein [Rhodococcus aetherivorans]WFS11491.1 FUSC family protein [Rhodococcus aetherivorans]